MGGSATHQETNVFENVCLLVFGVAPVCVHTRVGQGCVGCVCDAGLARKREYSCINLKLEPLGVILEPFLIYVYIYSYSYNINQSISQ